VPHRMDEMRAEQMALDEEDVVFSALVPGAALVAAMKGVPNVAVTS
jgi:hypothetical protein